MSRKHTCSANCMKPERTRWAHPQETQTQNNVPRVGTLKQTNRKSSAQNEHLNGAITSDVVAKKFSPSAQSEHTAKESMRTSEAVAKAHGIGKESVKRAEHFAHGLDAADTVSPGFKDSEDSARLSANC